MLTLSNPEIIAKVRELGGGLLPIMVEGKRALVVKMHKEALLAARENKGFKFYVAPLPTTSGLTIGLVTAIFDDFDEPLTVRTPLFGGDPFLDEILDVLYSEEINIYFFDEHAREWLSYRCSLNDPGSLLKSGDPVIFPEFQPSLLLPLMKALESWFSYREPEDDSKAITVTLEEELWPSDFAVLDSREGIHSYWGGEGYSYSSLTRDDNPGYFQERDIVAGFQKVFRADQLILNAYRVDEDLEFTDVVASGHEALILVQAKDSPNTDKSLARKLSRKIKTSEGQVSEALGQMRGAFNYALRQEPILLKIQEQQVELLKGERQIINLVVVKELFPSQGSHIAATMKEWYGRGHFLLVLDYPSFSVFTHQFGQEKAFVDTLNHYLLKTISENEWVEPKHYVMARLLEMRRERNLDGAEAPRDVAPSGQGD